MVQARLSPCAKGLFFATCDPLQSAGATRPLPPHPHSLVAVFRAVTSRPPAGHPSTEPSGRFMVKKSEGGTEYSPPGETVNSK